MYYPHAWHSSNQPSPYEEGPAVFEFDLQVPIPDEHCEGIEKVDCLFHTGLPEWFTNDTLPTVPATQPEEMYDKWLFEDNYAVSVRNPWSAPGTAAVTGEGCGVNGGNPDGCGKGIF